MIWILAIVGAIGGLATAEIPGLIAGGLLGYLLGVAGTYRERLASLERKLKHLEEIQASSVHVKEQQFKADSTAPSKPESVSPVVTAEPESTAQPVKQAASANTEMASQPTPEQAASESVSANPWVVDSSKSDYLSRPSPVDKLINWLKHYFTEGNLIVRVGVIVLFFGVSFLVKYSIDNALVPIELRLAGILIGSIIMLAVGWHFRKKNPGYALIMQGGAIAIMYLTIFASFKIYHLISPGYTFPLLIIFSALAMLLAVLQNSRALAVTAITGGFISPILTSTGSNDYISLFSYYLVLNLAIFAVSWFKSWRLLNVIGFAFTFIIATLWGVTRYRAENFSTTEPFLVAFFLIYVAISILFAIKQKPELKGYVDGSLVFGVPLVGFGLQAALVHNMEYGLAISAFVLGAFYLSVVKILWKNSHSNFRLLCEAMLAMGVIFTTLTIPFALDGRWTAMTWAIEGAGFVWIGLRQQRKLVVLFGSLIQLTGGCLYLLEYTSLSIDIIFVNTEYLSTLLVSVAGIVSAYLFNQQSNEMFKSFRLDIGFLIWGLLWWYSGGVAQVDTHITNQYQLSAYIAFFTVSTLIALLVALRYQWKLFNFFAWLLIIPLYYFYVAAINAVGHEHLFDDAGYLAWPFALLSCYLVLYSASKKSYGLFQQAVLHSLSYLLIIAVVAYELVWLLDDVSLANSWVSAAFVAVIIAGLQLINRLKIWPFIREQVAYQLYAGLVLIVAIILWSIGANFMQFMAPDPLPFIPLLNPVDIMQAIALFVVFEWYRRHSAVYEIVIEKKHVLQLAGGFLFVWFNVILFKTIHVIDGVAYRPDALVDSSLVQMSVSISWTLIGLAVMVIASRKLKRYLWIVGAVLTGIVVAKLFLIDLADRGTVERIVSFMVVGVLLLVVGYFSPVPPVKNIEHENT